MRLMQARRAGVVVHVSWMRAFPGRGRAFWQEVGREVRRRGVKSGDVPAVVRVARELESLKKGVKSLK